jgi:hypothetical protein
MPLQPYTSKAMVYDNMRFVEMVKQLLQRYSIRILLEVRRLIWYKIVCGADSAEAASAPREGGLCGFWLSLLRNPVVFRRWIYCRRKEDYYV